MEHLLLSSPFTIAVICLAAVFVLIQLIADTRKARVSRQLYERLIARAKQQNARSFTVIVESDDQTEEVIAFLDHLYDHGYSKIQTIVLVERSSNAHTKLAYYRRRYRRAHLVIVRRPKREDTLSVIRRYATGELIVALRPLDRVGRDFFAHASLYFVDQNLARLMPRIQPRLGKSLAGATQATASIWVDLWRTITPPHQAKQSFSPHIIYRRVGLLHDNRVAGSLYANRSFVEQPSQSWRDLLRCVQGITRRHSPWTAVVLIPTIGCLAVLGAVLADNLLLFGGCLLIAYSLTFSFLISDLKGYSLPDKLNLILFSPFSLGVYASLGVLGLLTALFTRRQA